MNNSLSSPLISGLIAGIKHRERRTNNNQCLSNSFLKIGQFEFLYKTITRFYYKKNEVVYREEDKADKIFIIYVMFSNQYNNKYIILQNTFAFGLSPSQSTAFFNVLS